MLIISIRSRFAISAYVTVAPGSHVFFLCPTSMQYGVHTISALCDGGLQGYILLRNTCADPGLKQDKDCSGLGRAVAAFAHHHLSCQFTSRPEALLDISSICLPTRCGSETALHDKLTILIACAILLSALNDHRCSASHSLPVASQDRSTQPPCCITGRKCTHAGAPPLGQESTTMGHALTSFCWPNQPASTNHTRGSASLL